MTKKNNEENENILEKNKNTIDVKKKNLNKGQNNQFSNLQNNINNEQNEIIDDVELDNSDYIVKSIKQSIIHHEKIIEESKNSIQCLKKVLKNYSKSINKKTKGKKNQTGNRTPTGFEETYIVPPSLRELFDIKEEKMPRTKVTGKFYEYVEKNGLKTKDNKRIMRVDDKLAKALELTSEQVQKINNSNNQKDIEGLNFFTAQSWIKRLYKNQNITNDLVQTKQETSNQYITDSKKDKDNEIFSEIKSDSESKKNVENIKLEDDLVILREKKIKK